MQTEFLRIEGYVQRVGFRAWTAREAERLGLDGWVRNEVDGAVIAALKGDAITIAAMKDLLLEGPRHARVDQVISLPQPPDAPPIKAGFNVLR